MTAGGNKRHFKVFGRFRKIAKSGN